MTLIFFKLVLLLTALFVFFGLMIFPQTEGRAANLDMLGIYSDPLIIYSYLASIPFFLMLYQAYMLANYIQDLNKFSHNALISVKKIKYCAVILPVLIVFGDLSIILSSLDDDYVGPLVLSLFAIMIFSIVAFASALLQKRLEHE